MSLEHDFKIITDNFYDKDVSTGDMISISDDLIEFAVPEIPYGELYQAGFFDHKKAKLIIIWGSKISRNRQIIMLRKLYPELKQLSTAEIYKIVQNNKQQWEFTEMGRGNASDIADAGKMLGLNIKVEEMD